jgi:hypothetical protein
VPRVITTALCLQRRLFDSVNLWGGYGGYRTIKWVSEAYGDGQGTRENLARRQERKANHVCIYGRPSSLALGGVRKSRLRDELRREEHRNLGRGSARIGTGPSMKCATGFSHGFPPRSGTAGVAHEQRSRRTVATAPHVYVFVASVRHALFGECDITLIVLVIK